MLVDQQTKDEVIKLYQNNVGTPTIYKLLSTKVPSISAVIKILREAGIVRRKASNQQGGSGKRALTKADDIEIAKAYLAGETITTIHKRFLHKVRQNKSISDSLKRSKITTRERWEYTKVQHDYFNKIDSEAKAYFLGWLITDGWVQKDSNEIGLQLQSGDLYIIELLQKELQIENPILLTEGMYRIVIHSPILKRDLDKYGVVPQKTHLSFLPYLAKDLMPHLIRGLIDGDGCLHRTPTGTLHINLCGTFQLCSAVRQFLVDELGVSMSCISPNSSIYVVTWTEQSDIEKLRNYLWPIDTAYALPRKVSILRAL